MLDQEARQKGVIRRGYADNRQTPQAGREIRQRYTPVGGRLASHDQQARAGFAAAIMEMQQRALGCRIGAAGGELRNLWARV